MTVTPPPPADPAAADALLRTVLAEAASALGRPVDAAGPLAAHLRRLAEDSLATAAALAAGRIGAEAAREAFQGRREALIQIREFAELAALGAAARAADTVFAALTRTVAARTGVDLAPLFGAPAPDGGLSPPRSG
ncbi:MAG TPA: hypothetical protein VF547_07370 [Allosphingosinicella sp.]|jgi:hypothetical protein